MGRASSYPWEHPKVELNPRAKISRRSSDCRIWCILSLRFSTSAKYFSIQLLYLFTNLPQSPDEKQWIHWRSHQHECKVFWRMPAHFIPINPLAQREQLFRTPGSTITRPVLLMSFKFRLFLILHNNMSYKANIHPRKKPKLFSRSNVLYRSSY